MTSASKRRKFSFWLLLDPFFLLEWLRNLKSLEDFLSRIVNFSTYVYSIFLRPLDRLHDSNKASFNGSRRFCSNPFKAIEIHSGGKVFTCCPTWLPTPIGDIAEQSLDEIWNGKQAQDIRASIHDGSFKYCNASACPYLKTATGPVQRTRAVVDKDLRNARRSGSLVLPHGPRKVICAYDRSCNLSCPSCRTEIIVENRNKRQILEIQGKIKNEALKDADYLYITGSGDPFGSPYFKEWLQSMNRADMPNLQNIHLHSNGLLWTPSAWAAIPQDVRQLIGSAEISIDAASAETYAVNRRGGNFEYLLENLEFISGLLKNGELIDLCFSMVVQENNFREMPDFVRLARRFRATRAYFMKLDNWGTFSEEEFQKHAVHLPTHPAHAEFAQSLKGKILRDPIVFLGNINQQKVRLAGVFNVSLNGTLCC